MSDMCKAVYKLLEWGDGEKGPKIIPYHIAQAIKWELLRYIY